MSSILKALKKLEQEKTARKPDSFKIDAEILRGSGQRPPLLSRTVLAAVALFLCGVGVTYLFMNHEKSQAPALRFQATENKKDQEISPATPLVPTDQKISAETPPSFSVELNSSTETNLQAIRPGNEKQQRQIQKPADAAKPLSVVPPKPLATETPLPAVSTTFPPPLPVKPVLKVHGIAFQDGAESAAVINGVMVSKGAVIEGARVEEIQKDRVRFSRNGEMFEITLEKSN